MQCLCVFIGILFAQVLLHRCCFFVLVDFRFLRTCFACACVRAKRACLCACSRVSAREHVCLYDDALMCTRRCACFSQQCVRSYMNFNALPVCVRVGDRLLVIGCAPCGREMSGFWTGK